MIICNGADQLELPDADVVHDLAQLYLGNPMIEVLYEKVSRAEIY